MSIDVAGRRAAVNDLNVSFRVADVTREDVAAFKASARSLDEGIGSLRRPTLAARPLLERFLANNAG